MITLQQHISESILDVDLDIKIPYLKNFKYFEDHFSKPVTLTKSASGKEHYRYKGLDIMYEFLDFYKNVCSKDCKKLKVRDAYEKFANSEDICIVTIKKPYEKEEPASIVQIIDCKNQNVLSFLTDETKPIVNLTAYKAPGCPIPMGAEIIAIQHEYYQLMRDVIFKKCK